MPYSHRINVRRVEEEADRQNALSVMRAIYRDEKNWVNQDEKLIHHEDVKSDVISWFVATVGHQPVGVLRVLYELPLDLYREYGLKMVNSGVDVEAFLRNNKIAEIGRFAVLSEHRSQMLVVAALMKAAVRDTIDRGFTHYITDVFEGEKHSPYEFHTRVMGFQVVGTHDTGELNCPNRRLTMLLDLAAGYRKLRAKNSWVFRQLTRDWTPEMHERLLSGQEVAAG